MNDQENQDNRPPIELLDMNQSMAELRRELAEHERRRAALGWAVAAAVAHYIADLRAQGEDHENLAFLTGQVLAQVAKRHRGIEGQEMIETWMEILELNDPETLLPRLARILDAIVGDNWWYDRDAIRAKLPDN